MKIDTVIKKKLQHQKIIQLELYFSVMKSKNINLGVILKDVPQSSSRQTTIVCRDQEPFSSHKCWRKLRFTPRKNKSSINIPSHGVQFVFISKHRIFIVSWWCSDLLPVEVRLQVYWTLSLEGGRGESNIKRTGVKRNPMRYKDPVLFVGVARIVFFFTPTRYQF